MTDFGMSKLMDMNSHMTPLTMCPGTSVYMPPEALITPPHYSNKLDCFSHGVLTIQTITRSFPSPGPAHKYVENLAYATGRELVEIPETERREKDIDRVDHNHPLLPLALLCLQDRDTERPSADELCETLSSLREASRYMESVERARGRTNSVLKLEVELREEIEKRDQVIAVCQASLGRERKEYEEECKSLQVTIQQVLREAQEEREGQAEQVRRLEERLKKMEGEGSLGRSRGDTVGHQEPDLVGDTHTYVRRYNLYIRAYVHTYIVMSGYHSKTEVACF